MKKLFIVLVAMFAMAICANANNYKLNDAAIDAVIENATEVVTTEFTAPTAAPAPEAQTLVRADGKEVKPVVNFLLNFFLGGFGIHRHYCGTAGYMWALYTFTFSGIFGIVPTVDLIFNIIGLVDGSGAKRFIDNRSFFAWI